MDEDLEIYNVDKDENGWEDDEYEGMWVMDLSTVTQIAIGYDLRSASCSEIVQLIIRSRSLYVVRV